MLIINKKYSNLLKGYQRAIELDQKLKTEWESKYKPELLGKLQVSEAEQMKEYQEKISKWLESERLSIAEWEKDELTRNPKQLVDNIRYVHQDQLEIERKRKRNLYMIVWICSSIACLFLFFLLIITLTKVGLVSRILISSLALSTLICSIGTFIGFMVKAFEKTGSHSGIGSTPNPQSTRRIPQTQPLAPDKAEDLLKRYSCPNVISRWMEEIQYKDEGKEYFRKLAKNNPEAIAGIPGEMAMLNEHIWFEMTDFEGIYILGFKTSKQGDIDGISITRKGVWILESKYFLGNVEYKNGIWKQSVFVRHPGQSFLDGWEEKEFVKARKPDVQLENSVEKISNLFSDYSKENPWMTDAINGTIVFTHENIDLDISNCGFLYAKIDGYLSFILKGQDIDEMTFERQLEITDILLATNRKYDKEEVSATQLAEDIYKQSVESLEKLIKLSTIS